MNTKKKDIRDMNKLRFRLCWIEFCSMPVFGCRFIIYPMVQFGLAGRWIKFPKGREHAQGVCSNFGQPKAEFNPTYEYTHCVYPPLLIAYIHHDAFKVKSIKSWGKSQYTAIIKSAKAKVFLLKHHYYSPKSL